MIKIAISCGDPNGIGPEIVVKAASKFANKNRRLLAFGSKEALLPIYKKSKSKIKLDVVENIVQAGRSKSPFILVNIGYCKLSLGRPTISSGNTAYKSIKSAFNAVELNAADAIVTAPISKEALHKAGVIYPGHTEMLADWCKSKNFLMMFSSKEFKSALATIHVSIGDVSKSINRRLISRKLEIAYNSLITDFGIAEPRIAVLGVNPHAGEAGFIGREEKSKIIPAIKSLRISGIRGVFVPDAFFANHEYKNFDLVFGMYHDQVLIPFKMLSFNKGVNFTAGLPIVRTSPDHGTAFDISGKNIADPSSMVEALKLAEQIAINRRNAGS